ncbi:hypothetical protein [Streptomyces sp. NPDC002763]|uniref:hypothetical protein n=1 Tax=Streptomyces sp. NPDC002763 TaxID=3154427 RepID=UPI00332D422B
MAVEAREPEFEGAAEFGKLQRSGQFDGPSGPRAGRPPPPGARGRLGVLHSLDRQRCVGLPAHRWQYRLLGGHPALHRAMAAATFFKFGLKVRLTDCVHKNAAYEPAGAVALDGLVGRGFDLRKRQ